MVVTVVTVSMPTTEGALISTIWALVNWLFSAKEATVPAFVFASLGSALASASLSAAEAGCCSSRWTGAVSAFSAYIT